MQVVIVRHGEALPSQVDPDRPLSDRGRAQARAVGIWLKQLGLAPSAGYHSGKARARQTAAIVSTELGWPAPVRLPGLLPGDPVGPVADDLRAVEAPVLLVSHLPFVHELTTALVGNGREVPGFGEGGTAVLERDLAGRWRQVHRFQP